MVIITEWADKIIFIHYGVLKAVTQKILIHTFFFPPKNQFTNAKRVKGKKKRDVMEMLLKEWLRGNQTFC